VLDVALREVSFRYPRGGFALRGLNVTFARSTHTAVSGLGTTTLLRLIDGTLRPASGEVIAGARLINDLKPSRRPLLSINSALEVSGRWSVQHALVAAVRARTLDREDRHREYALAIEQWDLGALLERRIDTLSSTEQARLQIARIELLRPGIVVADRLLERVAASERTRLADALYRMLRVVGATVISALSSREELPFTDRVVVLEDGAIVQSGSAAELFTRPASDAAAAAVGDVDVVPITIRGKLVESVIGAWELDAPPFQGSGIALVRPTDFTITPPGEDSDFVFGVEEAGFADGRWIARGILTGGVALRVALPPEANLHKGRLLALRYDPSRFTLLPRENAPLQATVPTDVVPPLRESR
jgi:ABC-type Fe3+/spermidine/putrescine transport system ATPase subunit